MFVMTNDGGPLPDDQVNVGPALCQRAFIFDVMARSIPIALLHGATFRDSKVADPPRFSAALTPVRIDYHIHLRARIAPRFPRDPGQAVLGSCRGDLQ